MAGLEFDSVYSYTSKPIYLNRLPPNLCHGLLCLLRQSPLQFVRIDLSGGGGGLSL